MTRLPKLKTQEEKTAALATMEKPNQENLNLKETNGKPWLTAESKYKVSYPAKIDGDIAAKLDFVFRNDPNRPSKNKIINEAIRKYCDEWLNNKGYI